MSGIQLWPFQQVAIDGIRTHFAQRKKRVILCLPTGGGKTICFSYMAHTALTKCDEKTGQSLNQRVLILTDRTELFDQADEKLSGFGIRAEPIAAGNKIVSRTARCYVGMVETYYNRLRKAEPLGKEQLDWLLNFDLVIIDEAHKGAFRKVFYFWKRHDYQPYVVGATATPISAKRDDPLSNYYDELVNPVQVNELIDSGFLVPAVTYAARIDRSGLKTDGSGEYTEESQMDMFASRKVYGGLIDKYQQYGTSGGSPLKTIVFNVNVEHSKAVCRAFNEAGITARHVDGNTEQGERDSIMLAYKTGQFSVLCNVGIATTGFDDPAIRVVIVNRATTSKALWLQMVGRGGRLHKGKEHFVLLDMGDNYKELDLWEQPVQWEEIWRKKRRKSDKQDAAPVKSCPSCEAILPIQASVCTACNYEFPKPAPAIEKLKEADFEVVSDGLERLRQARRDEWYTMTLDELLTLARIRNYKFWWIVNVLRERNKTDQAFRKEMIEMAKLTGFTVDWAETVKWKQ